MVDEKCKNPLITMHKNVSLRLHDCLSLGEVAMGLDLSNRVMLPEGSSCITTEDTRLNMEGSCAETHRLPLLLRLLHESRPISSVPTFADLKNISSTDDYETTTKEVDLHAEGDSDFVIDEVVARLEERAASYSAAEGVQVVACHLIPTLTKNLSRVLPLRRATYFSVSVDGALTSGLQYDVTTLEKKYAELLSASDFKGDLTKQSSVQYGEREEEIDCAESGNEMDSTAKVSHFKSRKRRRKDEGNEPVGKIGTDSDSIEFFVLRTMKDLLKLNLISLQRRVTNSSQAIGLSIDEDGECVGDVIDEFSNDFPMSLHDSILAEGARISSKSCDLPSTVASIMFHIPSIQHRHLVAALCRAAFTETPDLIERMGANCTPAVPSIISGCIDAFIQTLSIQTSHKQQHQFGHSIATICKQSLQKLASLSEREASNVLTKLSENSIMIALQFELMMTLDPLAASCLLIQCLSRNKVSGSEISTTFSSMIPSRSVFQEDFVKIPGILPKCFNFILSKLESCCFWSDRSTQSIVDFGKVRIFLKAFSLVTYELSIDPSLQSVDLNMGASMISPAIKLLQKLSDYLHTFLASELVLCKIASDQPIASIIAALTAMFVSLFPAQSQQIPRGDEINQLRLQCFDALVNSLTLITTETKDLLPLVLSSFKHQNLLSCSVFLDLDCFGRGSVLEYEDQVVSMRFANASKWVASSFEASSIAYKLTRSWTLELQSENAEIFLKMILEADAELPSPLLHFPSLMTFCIIEYCTLLYKNKPVKLPLILPFQVEQLAKKTVLTDILRLEGSGLLFMVSLLYCFLYYEYSPTSAFKFDPRLMPLKEVYALCENSRLLLSVHGTLCTELVKCIDLHCPEIRIRSRYYFTALASRQSNDYSILTSERKNNCKKEVMARIRRSIIEPTCDPDGLYVEKSVVTALLSMHDSELITTVTCSFLSTLNKPILFYTYPMLYRDPLILLKCPIGVWLRPGLRRVAFLVLSFLLETNESFIRSCTSDIECLGEYLHSRNEIIIQAILKICVDPSHTMASLSSCRMVSSFLRMLLSGTKGMTSILLRHGLITNQIEWITERIPETVEDCDSLHVLLSDRSYLSATEKLVVSEGVARVAILYGFRDQITADLLFQAAFAHLINSFFAVIGPAGVSTTYLVGDAGSYEVTSLSRKAAFRLLKLLHLVRAYRMRMRSEGTTVIQKMIGLCKGEISVGSLPAAITIRQKGLLKELLDSATKAAESLGLKN